MMEVVYRLQTDLETFKEIQNDRLDELLTNIDMDVRKVSQESVKVQSAFDRKVLEMKNDQLDEVKRLKSEIDLLKERMDNPCSDVTCDNIEQTTEERMKSREPSMNNLSEVLVGTP